MTSKSIYYVYQLRASNEQYPFYVGKGKNKRPYQHLKCKSPNLRLNRKIKNIQSEGYDVLIEYIWTGLNEYDAYRRECWAVHLYGRKDKNEGCLVNLTDGGDGRGGWTDEQREAHSTITKNALPENISEIISIRQKERFSDPKNKEYMLTAQWRALSLKNARYGSDNNLYETPPWIINSSKKNYMMLFLWADYQKFKRIWEDNNKPQDQSDIRKLFNTNLYIGGLLSYFNDDINLNEREDYNVWKNEFVNSKTYNDNIENYTNCVYNFDYILKGSKHPMYGTLPWESGKTKRNPESIKAWLIVDEIYNIWLENENP